MSVFIEPISRVVVASGGTAGCAFSVACVRLTVTPHEDTALRLHGP